MRARGRDAAADLAKRHRDALEDLFEGLSFAAGCPPEEKPVAATLLARALRREEEARRSWAAALEAGAGASLSGARRPRR